MAQKFNVSEGLMVEIERHHIRNGRNTEKERLEARVLQCPTEG
jgi:hypothetical protein